jgi:hypothetical protein
MIKEDEGMTQAHTSGRPAPLPLSDLFTRYLQRQADAHAQGLGNPEPADQVVPHEAVQVQPVDPQRAWDDALAVVRYFPGAVLPADVTAPDWPGLVLVQEPAVALAFCLGNYPQMVRNLHPLLAGDLMALRQAPGRPVSGPVLAEWVAHSRDHSRLLLAASVLRLARRFDEARELLRQVEDAPASWQAVRANEEAALAWHAGRGEEALSLWQEQEASVPVHFNRGMAALFLGQPALARPALAQAVAALPETSAWHHLGHLYLTLAE